MRVNFVKYLQIRPDSCIIKKTLRPPPATRHRKDTAMTKMQTRKLYIALAVTALVVCAVLIRVLYLPYSGFWRTLLYNALIGAWGVSVWWRILQRQTRNCLLLAAALMLLWLDLRLIRFDFAQSPTALRRLWYAYYIPMLLIPTLAVYALFYLDRSQSRPLPKHRYILFAVPVALFTLVLTNDCHQLVFAFPPGQEVSGKPEYTYRFGLLPVCVVDLILRGVYRCLSGAALPHPPHGLHPVAAAGTHRRRGGVRGFVHSAAAVAAQDRRGYDRGAVPDLYGGV